MRTASVFRTAVCATALMSASAGMADVTAEQVWDNWKTNLALYGSDGVSIGAETVGDGTVTVTGLTMTVADEFSTMITEIGTLEFTENGDGTVSVTMPDSYPVTWNDPESTDGADLLVSQTGLSIIVSGDPDAMNYDVAADSYEIRLTGIRNAEQEVSAEAFLRANSVSGSYQTDISAGTDTTFGFATASVDFLVDAKEPGSDGFVVFSGQMENVTTSGQIDLPEGADLDVPETFMADFIFQSETSAANTAIVFDFDIEGDAANGSLQAGAFTLGGDLNPATLAYTVSLADAAITTQAPGVPFPIAMSMSLLENVFSMPTAATDTPADFGYRLALTDFVINDEIWMMADPAGAIPRDPATIIFDVSGLAKLFFDLFDPEQADALAVADVPGELNGLTVNNIQVTAAGVDAKATGEFTFDNTDLETFNGLPRPLGEINIGVTGANGLIDTLVEMGLVPADQATMGRMMMGMFTQPAGDDALTSKIEINEDGHVLANGQRIQ